MEVFDHSEHTGVRMVVIIYVAGRMMLDFLTRCLCQGDHNVETSWGQTKALYARSLN